MSKVKAAARAGRSLYKAYRLGVKTRKYRAKAKVARKTFKQAKSLIDAGRKMETRAFTGAVKGSRQLAKSYFTRTGADSAKTTLKQASSLARASMKTIAKGKSSQRAANRLMAAARAANKVNSKGFATRAAFAAGGIRKRTVAATAGVAAGINSLRNRKRKPMSEATKRKISMALKGRKR